MRALWQSCVRFFVSLQLTVVLLVLSILLVFVATLDQVNLGVWAVQAKYFRSFFVWLTVPGTAVALPVFPGGYLVGGLLFFNLLAAQGYRFTFTWRKSGLLLSHFGLILLLVGELLAGLWQQDFQMRLEQGETKNYSDSFRRYELAIIDTTDPKWDEVVAVPDAVLADKGSIQHPKLPFRVVVKDYYPNASLEMRPDKAALPPSPATAGFGPQFATTPLPVSYKEDDTNNPAAFVEFVGPDGSLGTFLVSPLLVMPQTFSYGSRNFSITLRLARNYKPFSLTLLELHHGCTASPPLPLTLATENATFITGKAPEFDSFVLASGTSHPAPDDYRDLVVLRYPVAELGLVVGPVDAERCLRAVRAFSLVTSASQQ